MHHGAAPWTSNCSSSKIWEFDHTASQGLRMHAAELAATRHRRRLKSQLGSTFQSHMNEILQHKFWERTVKMERPRSSTIIKFADRFIPGNNIPTFLQTRPSGWAPVLVQKRESPHIQVATVKLKHKLSKEDLCWSTCCIENHQGKSVNYLWPWASCLISH